MDKIVHLCPRQEQVEKKQNADAADRTRIFKKGQRKSAFDLRYPRSILRLRERVRSDPSPWKAANSNQVDGDFPLVHLPVNPIARSV
jgi:hypothetical protein